MTMTDQEIQAWIDEKPDRKRYYNVTDPALREEAEELAAFIIPPCPSWCMYEPGHDYDSWLTPTMETCVRPHRVEISPDVSIGQTEFNKANVITYDAPTIDIDSTQVDNSVADLDARKASAIAVGLVAAVAKLDEIMAQ